MRNSTIYWASRYGPGNFWRGSLGGERELDFGFSTNGFWYALARRILFRGGAGLGVRL